MFEVIFIFGGIGVHLFGWEVSFLVFFTLASGASSISVGLPCRFRPFPLMMLVTSISCGTLRTIRNLVLAERVASDEEVDGIGKCELVEELLGMEWLGGIEEVPGIDLNTLDLNDEDAAGSESSCLRPACKKDFEEVAMNEEFARDEVALEEQLAAGSGGTVERSAL